MKFKIKIFFSVVTLLFALGVSKAHAANTCNGACTSNFDCATNYVCLAELGVCRGGCNPSDSSCGCVTSATTAPASTIVATPFPTPVTGNSLPTILLFGVATIFMLTSLLVRLK